MRARRPEEEDVTVAARTISRAGLVVQQCGPHVLIRGRDEATADAATLIRIPGVTGNALILASAGAHRHPGLLDVVHECVAALRSQDAPHTVWLAVPGLGARGGRDVPWLHRLAAETGIEIVAPQGSPIAGRGIGLYAGRAGWRRFGAGDVTDLSSRFPMPIWEHRLPPGQLVGSSLVTEPVPAGLAVRPAGQPSLDVRDPRFQTPFDVRVPKLVVGEPGVDVTADSVAALIALLPEPVRHDLLVVPAAEQVTAAEWAGRLATALNHGVTVATGRQIMSASGEVRTVVCDADGAELSEPLATILRHTPDGAPPEVLGVARPPAGWQLHGRRCYRPQAPSGLTGVIAEVLPGGLHVRLESDPGGVTADFDPRRWTLVVGDERRDVTEAEVAALCDLLEGLGTVRCRTVDVHVLGTSWQNALSGFEAYLRSLGVTLGRAAEPTRVRAVSTAPLPHETLEAAS
jgi:hypothetical protein